MEPDRDFYTVTMAKVYEQQGLWEKAAEIYRYLLEQEPQRGDLAASLAGAEKKIRETGDRTVDDLVPLFRRWIELSVRYRQLKKLRRLQRATARAEKQVPEVL